MSAIFSIEKFEPEAESWDRYSEQLEIFFIANDITDAKRKKAIFLTLLTPKVYNLLHDLFIPKKLIDESLTYEDFDMKLRQHFNPIPSAIVERTKFTNRFRKPEESISTFIAELRKLAKYCKFGDNLDDALRDRFIAGIQDENIQKKLLSEGDTLQLKKAVEIALSMETAFKDSQNLFHKSTFETVHKIKPKPKFNKPELKGNLRKGYICIRCNSDKHKQESCPYLKSKCHFCGKIGHLRRACLLEKKSQPVKVEKSSYKKINAIKVDSECLEIFNINDNKPPKPWMVKFLINHNKCLHMEYDTGSAYTIVSEQTFKSLNIPKHMLQNNTSLELATYCGKKLQIKGTVMVNVQYSNISTKLPLVVVEGKGISLCGRNWIDYFKIDPLNLNNENVNLLSNIPSSVEELIHKYHKIFEPVYGLLKDVKVKLLINPDVTPKFCKARSIPLAMKEKVSRELDRLQQHGILEPVRHSEWATPIVPILKPDGSIRICGDFKITANKAILIDQYPLPKAEEIFSALAGGEKFSKLDLRDAYNQLELDEDSRKLTVINTHKGLFQYTRLCFGINSAPALFQREMDILFKGLPNVYCSLDDILITGKNDTEHLQTLEEVLRRLSEAGVKIKKDKCSFMMPSIEFLGHVLDNKGLHPQEKKLNAILNLPTPTNVTELKSFLGFLSYYSKFLPNMSTVLSPLYKLLQNNCKWVWSKAQQNSFEEIKQILKKSSLLVHFDPSQQHYLFCDASSVGIGAVLSQTNDQGELQPVAFASRTLSVSEKKYSQLEKEALSLIFGVTKFRDYLLGRHFILRTDHKPLVTIFSENKLIPTIAANRIHRWAITLSAYNYTIEYIKGKDNTSADTLSRLPLKTEENTTTPPELVLVINSLDQSPVKTSHIREEIKKDKILNEIYDYTLNGWPEIIPENPEIRPYWIRRFELSTDGELLFWGNRIIIPEALRPRLLEELHSSHQGIVGLKNMSRTLFWWPSLDQEIERLVHSCDTCIQQARMPYKHQPSSWPMSNTPWTRIHIDFLGPFENTMILLIVDSTTKWIEAIPMKKITSFAIIDQLRIAFARFGIPQTLVSDNATYFTSEESKQFLKMNGIQFLTSPVFHPSSNGIVERAVQIIKQGLKKVKEGSILTRLCRILLNYRRTPIAALGKSPSELMFDRNIRSRLDFIKPDTERNLHHSYSVENKVWFKTFGKGDRWKRGKIIKLLGTRLFLIQTEEGNIVKRHVDQIRRSYNSDRKEEGVRFETPYPQFTHSKATDFIPNRQDLTVNCDGPLVTSSNEELPTSEVMESAAPQEEVKVSVPDVSTSSNGQPQLRRSSRVRRPPNRLNI